MRSKFLFIPLLFSGLFGQWHQQAKINASDKASGDNFGNSVSINGDYAIVGAKNDGGYSEGAAYIFIRSGTSWSEQAKLTASDKERSDDFGASVAISGNYAIIGDWAKGDFVGAAYIFIRSGTSWSQQAKLTAADASNSAWFGSSVSISGDYAIIGAYKDKARSQGGTEEGSAYIFVRSGTSWSQQAKLKASDKAEDDEFGRGEKSVSIDGDYAIIGARANDDAGNGSGSAYIFIRSGTSWSEQAKLTASDAAAEDYFGTSVSIDGDYAIVTANEDDDGGSNSGSAYIFIRSGTSWSQQAKLTASDAYTYDGFGITASISGEYAVVGAFGNDDDGNDSGSAYIFKRSGTSWSEQAKLTASDASEEDRFGESVAISGDYIIAAAAYDDDDGGSTGSAYIYKYNPDLYSITTLEHDDDVGQYNSLIQVDDDTYALAYLGNSSDGYISAFDIPADGSSITEVGTLQHDDGDGRYNSFINIGGLNKFALAYMGSSTDGHIASISISDDGTAISRALVLTHDNYNSGNGGTDNSIVHVVGDIYALASSRKSTDGYIKTFNLKGDGNMSAVNSLHHEGDYAAYSSLVKVDSDTYVLAYRGKDNNGFIKTFTISSDGETITEVAKLEHDTDGDFNSLVQADGDTYVLAYAGEDQDGYISTFTIPADGSSITKVATLEHDTDSGAYNSLVQLTSDYYALAYYGKGNNGYIKTFKKNDRY